MEDPEAQTTPAEFAETAAMSERTLQRRFLAQTGQTLTQWRHHVRMAAALTHLERGEAIPAVAHRAGYASTSSFTRAFAQHHGTIPSNVRTPTGTAPDTAPPPYPAPLTRRGLRLTPSRTEPEGVEDLALSLLLTDSAPPGDVPELDPRAQPGAAASRTAEPPPIPATATWPRINSAHVAIWVFRGRATIELPGRVLHLAEGDATIVPAGYATSVTTAPGGLLLPLGFRVAAGLALPPEAVRVTSFDADAEPALLHHVIATYSALHPPGYPAEQIFDLLATGPADAHPPRPLDVIELAARVARAPHLPDPLEALATELGLSLEDARRSVKDQTGLDARTWLRIKRMTHARELLLCGLPIAVVARTVGYAHQSSFSRAFAAVHGQSPQALLSEDAEAAIVDARRTAQHLGATLTRPRSA